jgi:hypothetical protein
MNNGPVNNGNTSDDIISRISNSKNNTYHDPLKFLDTLSDQKYIVLFYEDVVEARMVEFNFIKNARSKGQDGVYTFSKDTEKSFIEDEMMRSGIDVEDSQKQGVLIFAKFQMLENTEKDQ